MIIRIHERDIDPNDAVARALKRPVSTREGLSDHTVVAHWPGLDSYSLGGAQWTWTSADWAAHLDEPIWQHPFAASPNGDRRAIWQVSVRVHPDDRELADAEWAEIAHRLARTAGIQDPGEDHGCRWVAIHAQVGRLDLLANLIRSDGTWTAQPHQLHKALATESRRTETEMGLIAPRTGPGPQQAVEQARFARRPASQTAIAAQLAVLLQQLADERTGPLSTVRGLVEHAAHRLDRLPDAYGPDSAHQLELIARRLHGIQQDLDSMAAALPASARPAPARPTPPAAAVTAAPDRTSARFGRRPT